MPKVCKSKHSRPGARRGGRGSGAPTSSSLDRIVKQSGKVWIEASATTFAASLTLRPTIDTRLGVLASTFQLYRFSFLKVTLFPVGSDNTAARGFVVGMTPDEPENSGVPATHQEVMEMPYSAIVPSRLTIPQSFSVPSSVLRGRNATNWFETDINASSQTQFVDQGKLFIRTDTTSGAYHFVIEYTIEFSSPLPSSLTLARLRELEETELPQEPPTLVAGRCGPSHRVVRG